MRHASWALASGTAAMTSWDSFTDTRTVASDGILDADWIERGDEGNQRETKLREETFARLDHQR